MKKIEYYRQVLNQVSELFKLIDDPFCINYDTVYTDYHFNAKKYNEEVYFRLIEGRMQLGNMLKFITDERPYKKARLDRLNGDSDYIPPSVDKEDVLNIPDFDTNVETLDYVRKLLQEMVDNLYNLREEFKEHSFHNRIVLHLDNAINKITLARNYCGLLLGCIRDIRNYETS